MAANLKCGLRPATKTQNTNDDWFQLVPLRLGDRGLDGRVGRFYQCRFKVLQVWQSGLHTFSRDFELRGPNNAVEDEAAEIIIGPVPIEMRHHNAKTAPAVSALHTPCHDFAVRRFRGAAWRWRGR